MSSTWTHQRDCHQSLPPRYIEFFFTVCLCRMRTISLREPPTLVHPSSRWEACGCFASLSSLGRRVFLSVEVSIQHFSRFTRKSIASIVPRSFRFRVSRYDHVAIKWCTKFWSFGGWPRTIRNGSELISVIRYWIHVSSYVLRNSTVCSLRDSSCVTDLND